MDSDYAEMFEAIDACYAKSLQIPCLALLYTTIDSLGWLTFGHEQRSARLRFTRWVETYLLPELGQNCSSLDLYAARCSVLHGLSWESELSKSGQAKTLIYAMGRGTESASALSRNYFSERHVVCLHVDSLISALRSAVLHFFSDVSSNPTLKARIKAARGKTYAKIPIAEYEKTMREIGRLKGI